MKERIIFLALLMAGIYVGSAIAIAQNAPSPGALVDPDSLRSQQLDWVQSRGYETPEAMEFKLAWDLFMTHKIGPTDSFKHARGFMRYAGYPAASLPAMPPCPPPGFRTKPPEPTSPDGLRSLLPEAR